MKSFKRLFVTRTAVLSAKQRKARATAARKLRAAQRDQLAALGQRALIAPHSRFHYHP